MSLQTCLQTKRRLRTISIIFVFTLVILYTYCLNRPSPLTAEEIEVLMKKAVNEWPLAIDLPRAISAYKARTPFVNPINSHNFSFTSLPPSQLCEGNVLMTVMIKTSASAFENRRMLRKLWISDLLAHNLRYRFLIGLCIDRACVDRVRREQDEHHDLVQEDFIDSYLNTTFKFAMGLRYISQLCANTTYILFIDGDYFLNVSNLLLFIETRCSRSRFYAGAVQTDAVPFRDPNDKHFVSMDFYPHRWWPPFVAAGASLLTLDVVEQLYVGGMFVQSIPFDDVFYGFVAGKLRINFTNVGDMFPSLSVPVADDPANRYIVASHRWGDLLEIEKMYYLYKTS